MLAQIGHNKRTLNFRIDKNVAIILLCKRAVTWRKVWPLSRSQSEDEKGTGNRQTAFSDESNPRALVLRVEALASQNWKHPHRPHLPTGPGRKRTRSLLRPEIFAWYSFWLKRGEVQMTITVSLSQVQCLHFQTRKSTWSGRGPPHCCSNLFINGWWWGSALLPHSSSSSIGFLKCHLRTLIRQTLPSAITNLPSNTFRRDQTLP